MNARNGFFLSACAGSAAWLALSGPANWAHAQGYRAPGTPRILPATAPAAPPTRYPLAPHAATLPRTAPPPARLNIGPAQEIRQIGAVTPPPTVMAPADPRSEVQRQLEALYSKDGREMPAMQLSELPEPLVTPQEGNFVPPSQLGYRPPPVREPSLWERLFPFARRSTPAPQPAPVGTAGQAQFPQNTAAQPIAGGNGAPNVNPQNTAPNTRPRNYGYTHPTGVGYRAQPGVRAPQRPAPSSSPAVPPQAPGNPGATARNPPAGLPQFAPNGVAQPRIQPAPIQPAPVQPAPFQPAPVPPAEYSAAPPRELPGSASPVPLGPAAEVPRLDLTNQPPATVERPFEADDFLESEDDLNESLELETPKTDAPPETSTTPGEPAGIESESQVEESPFTGLKLQVPDEQPLIVPDEPVDTVETPAPAPAQNEAPAPRNDKLKLLAEAPLKTGFKGFCPVRLKDKRELIVARTEFSAEYRGQTYQFSSAKAKAEFERDPTSYAPAGGGHDVVFLDDIDERVEGSLDHAAWFQGRLFLFANPENQHIFMSNPEHYATMLDDLEALEDEEFALDETVASPPSATTDSEPALIAPPDAAALPEPDAAPSATKESAEASVEVDESPADGAESPAEDEFGELPLLEDDTPFEGQEPADDELMSDDEGEEDEEFFFDDEEDGEGAIEPAPVPPPAPAQLTPAPALNPAAAPVKPVAKPNTKPASPVAIQPAPAPAPKPAVVKPAAAQPQAK